MGLASAYSVLFWPDESNSVSEYAGLVWLMVGLVGSPLLANRIGLSDSVRSMTAFTAISLLICVLVVVSVGHRRWQRLGTLS